MTVGWYLLPSGGAFYGTLPPGVTDIGAPPGSVPLPYLPDGSLPEGVEDLAPFGSVAGGGALANCWQKLAVTRSGGLAFQLFVMGDSKAEGYATTRYRNRWIDRLRRRLQGDKPGSMGLLPASANTAGSVADVDWPGGDNPWTYSGVTGDVTKGLGFHGAQCTSGSITLTYFGDVIQFIYDRTPTGPAAAAVTLDGVAQTALNANGSLLVGQSVIYGTIGDYGFHTLVITVSSGTLVFEGALWLEGGFNGFVISNDVLVSDGTHAGFGAQNWAGVNNDWSGAQNIVENAFAGLVLYDLGGNDLGLYGRSPKQLEDDLVTMAQRLDAKLLKTDLGHLFTIMPGPGDTTPMVDACWRAAARLGLSRSGVVDLAQLRPGRAWGADLSGDGSHPNDAGHIWVAERLGEIIDPNPPTRQPTTPTRQVIDASTPATRRSSWTEAWTAITGSRDGIDTSGGGTTVGERRHRVWLDPGTYRSTIVMQEDTGLGTVEVLIGRYAGATAQLVSCGTKANAAGSPTLVKTRLGTSVTTDVPGWVPVVIRKTSASGAIRFVELVIDKTA